jgi:hypothetical protein
MAFIRQQASLTHQKEIKIYAHWSFADRQRLPLELKE